MLTSQTLGSWSCTCRCGMELGPSGPQVKVELESPFIQAAWEGNVSLIRAMLKGFPGVIDINHTASVTPLHKRVTTKRYPCSCHHTTALRAAVCNDHLEVVRVLIKFGASVNIRNCQNSTPLHEAASQKSTKIVEVLHKHGAHINVFDTGGLSPLCVALICNRVDTIHYLLKAGASALPPNPASLSAMHVAAVGGKLKAVKLLLAHGVSPTFSEPSPSSDAYIPTPLYVAAVCGHSDIVSTLISHPQCSPACRADALLLLGSRKFGYGRKHDEKQLEVVKELWMQALRIREEHHLIPKLLPPIPAYNNAVEIQNVNDLEQLFDSESNETMILMQSLIILERCMGFLYILDSIGKQNWKSFFHKLLSACYCLHDKLTEQQGQFEELVLKSYESLKRVITHPLNSSASASYELVELFVLLQTVSNQFHLSTQQVLNSRTSPQFRRLTVLTLEILEHLQSMCAVETPCGATTVARKVLRYLNRVYTSVLFCFLRWLQHSSHSIWEGDEERVVGSDECESSGREFVRKHLHITSTEKHTLLNFALSFIHSEELKTDLPVVIVALLRWGADSVINLPDSKGQRPLHLAVTNLTMYSETTIVLHLLDYGAHYDAVNAEGKAFYELSEAYPTDSPLPLVCQASRKIVVEAIPYWKLDIPKHVKEFVSLHDPKM